MPKRIRIENAEVGDAGEVVVEIWMTPSLGEVFTLGSLVSRHLLRSPADMVDVSLANGQLMVIYEETKEEG